MFTDSLLESAAARPPKRCLATLISFLLQAAGVGLLVTIPLMYTGSLPPMFSPATTLYAPAAVGEPDSIEVTTDTADIPDDADPNAIVYSSGSNVPVVHTPGRGGRGHGPGGADGPVGGPPLPFACIGCPVGNGPTVIPIVLGPPPQVVRPPQQQKPLLVSVLDPGMLVYKVDPQYTTAAKIARAEGPVVMAAIIDRSGRIEQLRVLSSAHVLLTAPAMGAVRQWRYRPYVLNGQAVEVETLITVNFRLTN